MPNCEVNCTSTVSCFCCVGPATWPTNQTAVTSAKHPHGIFCSKTQHLTFKLACNSGYQASNITGILAWREGKHVLALCSREDNMKSESPSRSSGGKRVGEAWAWHLMREYGIGLCSGKSPADRPTATVAVVPASLAPLPFGWAAKKRTRYYCTTLQCVSSVDLSWGRFPRFSAYCVSLACILLNIDKITIPSSSNTVVCSMYFQCIDWLFMYQGRLAKVPFFPSGSIVGLID